MVYKWYILPIGWLYGTYHLLREPETAIEVTKDLHFWVQNLHLQGCKWYLSTLPPSQKKTTLFNKMGGSGSATTQRELNSSPTVYMEQNGFIYFPAVDFSQTWDSSKLDLLCLKYLVSMKFNSSPFVQHHLRQTFNGKFPDQGRIL